VFIDETALTLDSSACVQVVDNPQLKMFELQYFQGINIVSSALFGGTLG
jgi:hypothetical protein